MTAADGTCRLARYGDTNKSAFALARFPLGLNHPSEKKSHRIDKLAHILTGEIFNFAGICSGLRWL